MAVKHLVMMNLEEYHLDSMMQMSGEHAPSSSGSSTTLARQHHTPHLVHQPHPMPCDGAVLLWARITRGWFKLATGPPLQGWHTGCYGECGTSGWRATNNGSALESGLEHGRTARVWLSLGFDVKASHR